MNKNYYLYTRLTDVLADLKWIINTVFIKQSYSFIKLHNTSMVLE